VPFPVWISSPITFSKSRKNWSIPFALVCSYLSLFVRVFLLVGVIAVKCGFVVPRPVSSMKPSPFLLCWSRLTNERMSIPMEERTNAFMTNTWIILQMVVAEVLPCPNPYSSSDI
jgi:hypothetical protein